jgi:hypothetical protein
VLVWNKEQIYFKCVSTYLVQNKQQMRNTAACQETKSLVSDIYYIIAYMWILDTASSGSILDKKNGRAENASESEVGELSA